MKPIRVSDRNGRYVPGPMAPDLFTPEQVRYLLEELSRISGALECLDDAVQQHLDDHEEVSP